LFNGEWTLIIFTLLTQCAVGIWLVAVSLRILIAKRSDPLIASQLTWRAILIVGPLISIALVISIFHLGSPMRAYSVIANLGSSWLSREIAFSGSFLFLWITAYINYRKTNTGSLLGWITTILGLFAVFSMSSIYYNTPIPAWARVNTFISFFATTLILGSIACATFVGLAGRRFPLNPLIRKLLWKLSIIVLGAVLLQLFFTAQLLESYPLPFLLYGLLLLVGSSTFTGYWYQCSKKPTQALSGSILYLSFALVFTGEIIGRYLFYLSSVPMMI
jgi:anaerobic dimethyl sulfoxide reductase subunit C